LPPAPVSPVPPWERPQVPAWERPQTPAWELNRIPGWEQGNVARPLPDQRRNQRQGSDHRGARHNAKPTIVYVVPVYPYLPNLVPASNRVVEPPPSPTEVASEGPTEMIVTRPEPVAPTPPTIAPSPPKTTSAVPAGSKTMYVIPGCYLGNVSPKEVALPPGCDLKKLMTILP
jgi:hypothetical protein